MSVRTNVIANYLGQGWTALMGLAFIPLYVRALGVEAYGLVGVYAILQAAVTLLDLGMTPTLNREMARLQAGLHSAVSIRNLLRSLEILAAMLALAMIAIVCLLAPWLTDVWFSTTSLNPSRLTLSLQIMGFALASRWLEQLYRGALQGLQDLVWLNATQAALATARWGGAVLVLAALPSIEAFFAWQGVIAILSILVLSMRTYRLLPPSEQAPRFSLSALADIRAFAGGMFLGSLLGFLLIQSDKIIISKMLSLEALGLYTFASVGASAIQQLFSPMNTAVFPRLTELVAQGKADDLANVYLRSCEWMAAVVIPPALLLTFFPGPTLLLWTGDSILSKQAAPLLSILVLGTLLNGLMNLPYMLQLANGWTSLSVKINLSAVCITIPTTIWAVSKYGAAGAGFVWVALNAAYIAIGIHFMHIRILPCVKRIWYKTAVFFPLAAGSAAALSVDFLAAAPTSRLSAVPMLVGTLLLLCLATWSTLPTVRSELLTRFRSRAL